MRRLLSPARIAGALAGLVVVAFVVLYLVPSNDYIFLPDAAHPVAPLVRVQGGNEANGPGSIYFVDVFERRATLLEKLFPWIRSGATLIPASFVVPPGVSDAQQRNADLREMTMSQRVAAAVALRKLGYHVVAKPDGVIVDAVELGSHAVGKLQPTDKIVSVNGVPTLTIAGAAHRARQGEARRRRHARRAARHTTRDGEGEDRPRPGGSAPRDSSDSRPTSRRTSSCRSRCRSTPATSAARRRGSRSRSR